MKRLQSSIIQVVTRGQALSSLGPSLGDLFERLPIELQTEIFLQAIPHYPSILKLTGPIILSQVCRKWRIIALGTPKLWSSFSIHLPSPDANTLVNDCERAVYLLNIWIQRSRNNPLSFLLIQEYPRRHQRMRYPNYAETLLTLLFLHSQRWRRVYLSLWAELGPNFFVNDTIELPMLHALTIETNAPLSPAYPFLVQSLPWHQITELCLINQRHTLTLDQLLSILSKAVNIRWCRANVICDLNDHRTERLSLPDLSFLHLVIQSLSAQGPVDVQTDVDSFMSFLECFEFPNLWTLRLEWLLRTIEPTYISPAVGERFIKFIQGIGITLQEFELLYLPISDTILLDCLTQLPLVTNLELKYSLGAGDCDPITDHLLRGLVLLQSASQLIKSDSSRNILPQLKKARFETYGALCSSMALTNFLQSRTDDIEDEQQRLEYLKFLTGVPVFEQYRCCLDNWRLKEGLDVSSLVVP
ncbi:hypothetical protein AMATHDRAFT_4054 [Amanita thiersii Skay4041]|uniref:Uncharacterized protein n=1 Tax=Amanita thiersii Skay4041 TaxID=703135 RepID=A0A2A9NJR5_9AGAR|nr:hypothetical protein AMATHDRAFT_4054 [Amanita thiersii Skay4041]